MFLSFEGLSVKAFEGNYQEYLDFEDFYSQPGHTLEEYNEVMDVEEYTNMMITNIFQSNTDFPGNNNVMWKPMVEGGRWRFIIKDVDRAFGIWGNSSSQQYLNWVTRKPSDIGSNESANSRHISSSGSKANPCVRFRLAYSSMSSFAISRAEAFALFFAFVHTATL